MQDFTNHIYDSLIYRRRARFKDFIKFKPNFVRSITCIGGKKVQVWKEHNRHIYWLYQCQDCSAIGITRTDRMNVFRCKCRKNEKRPRRYKEQPNEKTCPDCKETYPLIQGYWYKRVRGSRVYFTTYCKKCRRNRDKKYYDKNHVTRKEQSGAIAYTRDDCGRVE